jgi:23S rRNA (adenine2503-C2)-methyltransferase
VRKFIDLANAEYGLNIGQRHITLSTCGIVPKILELANENLQITLAISLLAPNDSLRKSMMPVAYKYTIEELLNACTYYIKKTNRRVTFEYSLVNDVNDNKENAEELSRKLKGMLCHVNLIPINEIKENTYKKSSSDNIKLFYNILTSHGIETTIRKEMGADINAACGQLRRSYLQSNTDKEGV